MRKQIDAEGGGATAPAMYWPYRRGDYLAREPPLTAGLTGKKPMQSLGQDRQSKTIVLYLSGLSRSAR